MDYLLHILIIICIYCMLSVSLNLVAGFTGLLSIAHAAFFGIGAYTGSLMALRLGTPFGVNLVAAVFVCGLFGAVVAIPALRIRGDYFAIATFAFQVIVFNVLNNWVGLTEGPRGLPGIPRPRMFGWTVSSNAEFFFLVGLCCLLIVVFSQRIVNSPIGRVLIAIREDEMWAMTLGKNVSSYKVIIFAIGASIAAVPGVLYAHYITFIDPTSFTVMESIFVLSIVILGGAGSVWGPIVGAAVLVSLPEVLRFTGLPGNEAANVRQIIYGAMLVGFMMWRPGGLMGRYAFESARDD